MHKKAEGRRQEERETNLRILRLDNIQTRRGLNVRANVSTANNYGSNRALNRHHGV